jgi:hypothetical protein
MEGNEMMMSANWHCKCEPCRLAEKLWQLENEIVRIIVDPSESFYRGDRVRLQKQHAALVSTIKSATEKESK